jgi:hypothetical protein
VAYQYESPPFWILHVLVLQYQKPLLWGLNLITRHLTPIRSSYTDMATSTLRHPAIGDVIGNADSEGVVQYLGLQYATLADRFAPPQLKQYSLDSNVDATRNG